MPDPEQPILQLIQEIKDGRRDPKTLSKEERVECTEVLFLEGMTDAQVSQFLGKSLKSIKRYREELRQKNALVPSVDLAKKLIGDLLMKASMHHAQLMRLSRKSDGSISEKTQAEYYAWLVIKDSTQLLQSLGYLPLAPQKVVGDIFHHADTDENLSDLKNDISSFEAVALECGGLDPASQSKLDDLKKKITQIEVKSDLEKLQKQNPGQSDAVSDD